MTAPSENPRVRAVQDRTTPEDQKFAGVILLTAALGEVADELKVVNRRIERLLNVIEEREARTWSVRISRKQ